MGDLPIHFPPPAPGDPIRVSGTLFVTFKRCAASALARLEGRYPPESRPSFTGALTHRLIRRHLESGPIDDEVIEQACREEIGSGLNHKMAAIGVRSPSMLRPLIDEVSGLYRRFRVFPQEGFAGAEIELVSRPADGVELVGKIDAVFREGTAPTLIDWKTGSLGEPGDQLAFYGLMWALERSELPVKVAAVSIQTGERTEAILGVGEVEAVAAEVSELVSTIRRTWRSGESLAPTGGPWCRYCPIVDGCPEGGAAVRVLGLEPAEAVARGATT